MKTHFSYWCTLLLLFLVPVAASAQNDAVALPQNIFSRLQQYDPLVVVIETNIKKLRSGGTEETWLPGVFKIMKGKTADFEQKIQIATRGNMRKKTCDFPPVKIRFYEGKMESDSIEDINELKVVVGCRNSNEDDQLVMKECLVYELYNLFTEESFRVKPATVQFKNPEKKKIVMETTAFFIESEKELATRLGGRPIKPRIISPKGMDTLSYDRMCLFQFMIGNTDWGAYTRHNMKVIGFKGRPPVAIPYDFDYAGVVDADYAIPSVDLPLQTVRERYYLGLCRSAASYNALFKTFLLQKERVLKYCDNSTRLITESRQQVRSYLESFFAILEDPKTAQKRIIENCDKRIKKEKVEKND